MEMKKIQNSQEELRSHKTHNVAKKEKKKKKDQQNNQVIFVKEEIFGRRTLFNF